MINRSNLIIMLLSIELMLLAISFLFINFVIMDGLTGQIFAIMIITVAAVESAIGLAVLVTNYRVRRTIGV